MALQTPSVLLGNALGVLLIAAIFWNAAGPARVLPWVGVAALLWVLRLVHWRQLPAAGPQEDGAALRRWRSGWRVRVVSMAAWWGVAVWLFWDAGAPHQRLMLLLIVYSYALGSVQLLAMQPRVFVAFLVVLLVPTIARVALDDGQPWHWQLAGVLTLLFAITLVMGRTHGDALSRALWLKSRTDTLAEQLRQETAQAQEAHRQAEAASRAKTQFLAAASHDLRQPLHAMGLFAETLRHRVRDAEVADLVGSIQASVDALEGLFAELLDLSRLDAGAVSIEPRAVRLETLYARLRLSFEPAALDKGLALGFRGAALWVRADPLALERMLRNLVANAVRYTDAGGVLVSARVRGDRVLLQVWDSGIGVPPAALPRLFEEFYQAHPGRAVSASERRGMGLGLSIVGRLAALCGTRVQVHSREGRGSVFGFELPRAQPASPVVAAASVPAGPVATLQGLHAVVVDDGDDTLVAATVTPAGKGGLGWPAIGAIAGVLGGLLVGTGILGWQVWQQHQIKQASMEAQRAAISYAQVLTSIDSNKVDENFKDVLDGATGEFKDMYSQSSVELRQLLIENKATAHGVVVDSAVQEASKNKAVVLLFVDQSVSNTKLPDPRIDRSRMKMTLEKVDGRWRASKVELP